MKFKLSWIASIAPLIFPLITEALNEYQMRQNCQEMVKEEVERTLRENGYIVDKTDGS
jgi:hypothetical protein